MCVCVRDPCVWLRVVVSDGANGLRARTFFCCCCCCCLAVFERVRKNYMIMRLQEIDASGGLIVVERRRTESLSSGLCSCAYGCVYY